MPDAISDIRSDNETRPWSTLVPHWRMSGTTLDPFEFQIACWLSSHTDRFMADKVTARYIATQLGMSPAKVCKSLDRLTELRIVRVDRVVIPQSAGGVRFKIAFDWDVWQTPPTLFATQTNPVRHANEPCSPRKQHYRLNQLSRTEEDLSLNLQDRSLNLDDKPKRTRPSATAEEDGFDDFWDTCPRKIGKKDAHKIWTHLTRADRAQATAGMKRYAIAREGQNHRYTAHPATWLRGERWNDATETLVGEQDAKKGLTRRTLDEMLAANIEAAREYDRAQNEGINT